MDWVAANAALPSVVNMSLGGEPNAAMDAAVQALVDAGMAVAVAAGNEYADACDPSPARAPNALTVAASDATDRRADFSNAGRCVDFFAPGAAIISASSSSTTGSRTMSGTSMAAPHVAGAAALMLEMEPSASPARVREMLWDRLTANVISDNRDAPPHLLYVLGESGNPPPPWPAPIPGITLAAIGYKTKGVWHVVLEWTGMGEGHANVYRDGVLLADDVSYGGLGWRYVDWIGTKGSAPSNVYRVCDETDAECSNEASVSNASGKKAGGKQ
jgi:subtilisin family serine protease